MDFQIIWIEQQYIRTEQPAVKKLLSAIVSAKESHDVDVKKILAKGLNGGRDTIASYKQLEAAYGLKKGTNVQILNPRHFIHCHNKFVIVDGESVLISSQNWSDFAVTKNREAGILISYPKVAQYSKIFEADWETGLEVLRSRTQDEGLEALYCGRPVVKVNWGDYAFV